MIPLTDTIDFDKVSKIEVFRTSLLPAISTFKTLIRPPLHNLDNLAIVVEAHQRLQTRYALHDATDVFERRQMLFVMLYLYCPRALVGGRIVKGLRCRLGDIFHLNSHCTISANIDGLTVLYRNDTQFREGVNRLYRETYAIMQERHITE
jgi:hypothetical protein